MNTCNSAKSKDTSNTIDDITKVMRAICSYPYNYMAKSNLPRGHIIEHAISIGVQQTPGTQTCILDHAKLLWDCMHEFLSPIIN